jgi:hypothetical protein
MGEGDYENLGRKHYFGRRTVFPGLGDIFWFWSLVFGDWVNCCRGTRLLGVLGSGARNPHRILELGS